jgi:hypothetical protein
MDDTLEPGQVREIGKQVAESPFARELTDRINRVTRQRRLTVPNTSGNDATDPNIVAGYLDNDLDPDAVAEFEKRCLTSDVNLAEAASVHQILSLLGQKVKVPDAARVRMYQLVKGREAIAPRRTARARRAEKEPVTKPIQPWVVPEPPRRPWVERYGPAAACLVLIGVASWTAWQSLSKPPAHPAAASAGSPAVAGGDAFAKADGAPPAGEPAGESTKVAAAGESAKPQPDRAPEPPAGSEAGAGTTEAAKTAKAEEAAKSKNAATPVVPAGSAGLTEKSDGILLRYNEEKREWDRLVSETSLKTSDRLLCLLPFRASIDLGKMRIGLVDETEVRVLSRPSAPAPAIELLQGRILVRQPGTNTLKVTFAKQTVTLEMSQDAVVGLERVDLNMYGQPVRQPQPLGVLCQQGEVTLAAGGKQQALKPLNVALVDAGGQIQVGSRDALPPWVTGAEPTPYELQLRDQFVKMFHANRPVLAEIVGAIDDERPETKQLAVGALKALGDLSLLMPTLSRPDDPVARRATLGAIRAYMMQGPDAAARVRAELDEQFGENLGGVAHHMLTGYTPDEAAKPDLYNRLVGLLSPEQESVGIRELALDTLRRLTGRDDLGYDPDRPAGKGFDAWNDLLRRNELRPPPPRPAKAKNAR